ncbi:MAG TPA: adenine deaminase C-terminal domain-containing protein, partial [Bacillales bacterium]|nr:adenine deaminase C-terminal domain-containing protein [Bacillales bacterium]
EIIASMPLSVAGLMSEKAYSHVDEQLRNLNKLLADLGFTSDFNPFLTLSFLALPVIPEIKLTDLGLFDVTSFQHVDINANN